MSLWAVTSYFNVGHSARRRDNFRHFRERLGTSLLAIELGFDGINDLAPNAADIVVHVSGGDVMWQKERLINLALSHLPGDCTAVAVVDCDILFPDPAWPKRALAALASYRMVQLFEAVHYLSETWSPGAPWLTNDEDVQLALPRGIATHGAPAACINDVTQRGRGRYSPGMAWAYPRDLLARHGLFQWNIIGGGDTSVSAGAVGAFDAAVRRHQMTPPHRACYLAWAEPWFAAIGGKVGHLAGDLFHMWHGDLAHRQAHTRHAGLAAHGYDPGTDVAAMPGGPLRWASDKPALHQTLAQFFAERDR